MYQNTQIKKMLIQNMKLKIYFVIQKHKETLNTMIKI